MSSAKNMVREAEVIGRAPDPAMADLAEALAEGIDDLAVAFAVLAPQTGRLRRRPPTQRCTASAGWSASTGTRCQR